MNFYRNDNDNDLNLHSMTNRRAGFVTVKNTIARLLLSYIKYNKGSNARNIFLFLKVVATPT